MTQTTDRLEPLRQALEQCERDLQSDDPSTLLGAIGKLRDRIDDLMEELGRLQMKRWEAMCGVE